MCVQYLYLAGGLSLASGWGGGGGHSTADYDKDLG